MDSSTILENIERVVTILAIIAGGAWAYLHYVRGRVHRPRLKPTLTATLLQERDARFVLVKLVLENVGLSKVPIQRKGTGMRVFTRAATPAENVAREVDWQRQATVRVLEDHGWIEPSETVTEELMLSLPRDGAPAVMLHARIVSRGIVFKVRSIAVARPQPSAPDSSMSGENDVGRQSGEAPPA